MKTLGAEDVTALVTRLDEGITKEGAWVRVHTGICRHKDMTIDWEPGAPHVLPRATYHKDIRIVANRQGFLRLGVECLKAAIAPTEDPAKKPGLVNNVRTDWGYLVNVDEDVSCHACVGRFETTPAWIKEWDDSEKGKTRSGWLGKLLWGLIAGLSIVGTVATWRFLSALGHSVLQ